MRDYEPLPRTFFAPSAETVARELLGQLLLRNDSGKISGGVIVETEAYLEGDPACHAFRGPTNPKPDHVRPAGICLCLFHLWLPSLCKCRPAIQRAGGRRCSSVLLSLCWVANRSSLRGTEFGSSSTLLTGPEKFVPRLGIDRSLNGADLCEAAGSLMIAAESPDSNLP